MPVYDPRLFDDRATCFLDDSSLDSAFDEHAVLGGITFNPSGLVAFDEHWSMLMHRFDIPQPFHMRDLSRGQRLEHVKGCRRWCLLAEVTAAINAFKLYTVTISLNNREHRNVLSPRIREAMRAYRLAFFGVLVANAKAAPSISYPGRFAYVLDRGTRYSEQVIESHEALLRLDEDDEYRLGPLAFDDDKFSTHLQAADVVAWTKRRITAGKPLVGAFEVLIQLFENNHTAAPITSDLLRGLDERFSPHVTDDGWTEEPPPDAAT